MRRKPQSATVDGVRYDYSPDDHPGPTALDVMDRRIVATVRAEADPLRYVELVDALRELLAGAG